MKVDVLNINGEKTGRSVDLPDSVFGIEPNEHVLYLSVKQYLANQRQGTHKAKERNEITGSTRKIKRQKGTGTARAGDIKNPLFRSGGRTFGPRPRDYEVKLNKKVRKLARRSALSSKAQAGGITILEDFTFDQPKTREFAQVLENLQLNGKKALFVVADYDKNLYLSGRNLKQLKVVHARDLNPYHILHANSVVISENSVEVINDVCS
ncbi:MAG: 50S ribosomal protein L4 [Saprospiraceae bacterium]|nr:50S ribosomal protein L4 [Saprospiraceae bacterium]